MWQKKNSKWNLRHFQKLQNSKTRERSWHLFWICLMRKMMRRTKKETFRGKSVSWHLNVRPMQMDIRLFFSPFSISHTHTFSLSLSLSLSLSNTLTLSHTLSLSHSHSHTFVASSLSFSFDKLATFSNFHFPFRNENQPFWWS